MARALACRAHAANPNTQQVICLCHNGFTSAGPAVIAIARCAVGLCKRSMKGNRPVLASKHHAFGRPHADDPISNSHVRAVPRGLIRHYLVATPRGQGGGSNSAATMECF